MSKLSLHPRNLHSSQYNFKELTLNSPDLKKFIIFNIYNNEESINFSDQKAVKSLNKALLNFFYGIKNWDIPPNYLCPPIPGRADYIHYAADLLSQNNEGKIPRGKNIRVLDIGTGANCVYPIIGTHQYGWSFVGTDIDKVSFLNAKKIINENPSLLDTIELRQQNSANNIFTNIILPDEKFDLTICNPPFHASQAEATAGTIRKNKNLKIKSDKKTLNFGGQNQELWCAGGEATFIKNMILESKIFKENCLWFSSLVSKKENLSGIYGELKRSNAVDVKTFEMAQGQKISRFVAWTYKTSLEQKTWSEKRWI